MFNLFKKTHRELDRVNITYEPRIQFDSRYDEELEKYSVPKKLLLDFPGFPMGGFVRDVFHGDTPNDLDLFFMSKRNFKEVARFLFRNKWVRYKKKRIDTGKTGQYGGVFRKKSGCAECFKKDGKKIDLIFKRKLVSPREELAFFSQVYIWDLKINRFFLWADPTVTIDSCKDKEDENTAFEHLQNKQLILNNIYARWERLGTRGHKYQSTYLKEKIISLIQKGWGIKFGESNIFGHPLLLPFDKMEITRALQPEEVRSYAIKFTTTNTPNIRRLANDLLRDYQPELATNFLQLIKG